jgi:tetratricopeptide (TPR) repeat protein
LVFAYNSLSLIAYYLDRFSEEKEATDRLLEIARASGEKWLVGLALALSGMSAFREKDYLEAESLSEASLAESDEISDAMVSILSRNTLGHVAVVNGELTKAKTCFLHCMRESEKIGFRWAVGNATKYLGQVALLEGDFLEAETYFLQSLRIADDLGLNRDIANHLYEFAKLRVAQGRVTEAVELLVVLLQQPASRQARLGRGRIRDSAQALLGEIEADLLPVTYSSVLEGGWEAELDEAIAALLDVKKGG